MKRSLITVGVMALTVIVLVSVFASGVSVTTSDGKIGLSISHVQAAELSVGEFTDSRTETSKLFYLGQTADGRNRFAIDSFIGAIHYKDNYKDERSPWLDIDTTIIDGRVSKAPYDLQIYLTDSPGFRITSKQSGAYDVRLKEARISDTNITKVLPDTKVVPEVKGNKVTWVEYYPGVDIVLTADGGGVHLNRIIKNATTAKEYDVAITELEKGVIQLQPIRPAIDATGQQILMEEKPIADGRTETLKLEVLPTPGQLSRVISYPIVDAIDVQVGAGADDGRINSNSEFNNTATTIKVGLDTYSYSSFIRFTGISGLSGTTIDIMYVSHNPDTKGGASFATLIYAEDAAAPSQIADLADFNSRVKTTASVAVNTLPGWGWSNSPSLITIGQELANSYDPSVIQIIWLDNGSGAGSYFSPCSYEYGSHTYGMKIHIEYTAGGGTPSLTNTPASKDMGTVFPDGRAIYAKGNAPGNPVETGNCTFIIVNNGSITENITASMTNLTGGAQWTITSSAPGANTFRLTAYYAGQNPASGVVLSTSAQAFYNGLAASANISWDFKLEMPTSSTDATQKTGTLQFTAIAP